MQLPHNSIETSLNWPLAQPVERGEDRGRWRHRSNPVVGLIILVFLRIVFYALFNLQNFLTSVDVLRFWINSGIIAQFVSQRAKIQVPSFNGALKL